MSAKGSCPHVNKDKFNFWDASNLTSSRGSLPWAA